MNKFIQPGILIVNFRILIRALLLPMVVTVALMAVPQSFARDKDFKPTRPGEVYLLRGLANIFSLGLDEMGDQFHKFGMESYVYNHKHWQSLVDDIVERSYENEISFPIIIIGHSLGAGAAPQMATALGQRNIPVTYVVMFDPVEPTRVGKNVEEIINYYIPHNGGTNVLRPLADFEGSLQNVNVRKLGGFTHLNIDYNKQLRRVIYDETLKYSDRQIEGQLEEKEAVQ